MGTEFWVLIIQKVIDCFEQKVVLLKDTYLKKLWTVNIKKYNFPSGPLDMARPISDWPVHFRFFFKINLQISFHLWSIVKSLIRQMGESAMTLSATFLGGVEIFCRSFWRYSPIFSRLNVIVRSSSWIQVIVCQDIINWPIDWIFETVGVL